MDLYYNEFIGTLVNQAVDRKDRYVPVQHKKLQIGDIVLIREDNVKTQGFPMGIGKNILVGGNGEITGAEILKGKTRELTKRHNSCLIPILRADAVDPEDQVSQPNDENLMDNDEGFTNRPKRLAAKRSQEKTREILCS